MRLEGLKIAFHTLGCKVNIYESQVMEEELRKAGAVIVPFEDEADVYIINTCSVTNIADRKSRQMIHRARKNSPDAVIAACGCYIQVADPEDLGKEGIDILIGTERKGKMAEILAAYEKPETVREISDVSGAASFCPMELPALHGHTRADIKIQDGCNQFCTYCIIPYARGRIRSKQPEDVIREIRGLSESGIREIVLTGIHLSSYGKDLDGEERLLLPDMIERVQKIPGVERIRLGSLEPRIVTEEFAKRMAGLDKLCPHFHLSLQSGSETVLKRMNRHYTPDEYFRATEILRTAFDNPAITTDVIAGFPGETPDEFEETLRFTEKVGFYEMHVFRYSRRKGTAADRMEGQLTEAVKAERSGQLIALGDRMSEAYRRSRLMKECEVLTEEPVLFEGKQMTAGYTREYIRVLTGETVQNRIVKGKLCLLSDGDRPVYGLAGES